MTNEGLVRLFVDEQNGILKAWYKEKMAAREEKMTARKAAGLLQGYIDWKRIRGKFPQRRQC